MLADDQLLARVVHRHSARKAYYVHRYAEIVGTAMAPHWPQIWWVELFAGPGPLTEIESGRFLPGSPIEALSITNRFTGYVFADLSGTCVEALRERTAGHDCRRGSRRPGSPSAGLVSEEFEVVDPREFADALDELHVRRPRGGEELAARRG